MAIPNRLLITPKKIRNSEIKELIDSYPEFFANHEDAEFNILAVFLMHEKIKGFFILLLIVRNIKFYLLGVKSFFYHMFNVISDCSTLIKWSDEELEELEDSYLKKKVLILMY